MRAYACLTVRVCIRACACVVYVRPTATTPGVCVRAGLFMCICVCSDVSVRTDRGPKYSIVSA